ncbi:MULTISPECIES: hypothetical protein [unclassified Undibacterium]|uniref:hypothetical protein n=1 Tax=unclassified Undibacterium TaxID=2630295 RepID=UPI002AC9B72F|nr:MULTISPECIES: hypothetical protein [unclassified Undibacterium]MEB0139484.1 hypothetical protein [Undibacterium sp. CCC2.1]MEB0172407.1 hypothetical protein [Undibacterium sp. CCC1.1]MEB0175734.1 hypothetical protein [Undibacterium sp. CCC3.4]MEB0214522.1 hypothetical protein [Undibacterium sp. 5I2]WPX42917.1 hypothetical protein RHM61_16250 [Undibacterium sp. CCC3.4]
MKQLPEHRRLEFQRILENLGLGHASLYIDADELDRQEAIDTNVLTSLQAFELIVPSLWDPAMDAADNSDDTLYKVVRSYPSAFGLDDEPSTEQVRSAIITMLRDSADLTFSLVYLADDDNEAAHLYWPEYGETLQDYWVWLVRGSELPHGPTWALIDRQQTDGAYHYGYW